MKVLDWKTVEILSDPIADTFSSGLLSKSLTSPSVVLVSVTAYKARMAWPQIWQTVSVPSSHLLNWRRWNRMFTLEFSRLWFLWSLSFWLSISSLMLMISGWNGINGNASKEYLLLPIALSPKITSGAWNASLTPAMVNGMMIESKRQRKTWNEYRSNH